LGHFTLLDFALMCHLRGNAKDDYDDTGGPNQPGPVQPIEIPSILDFWSWAIDFLQHQRREI